ncbi:MAG TPA: aspartate kinase [Candidatus Thermoplasmatota archaeon]|nr:aspartate kinase [Candidatus Thermoplasmatota archaeon]
MRVMKFGGTSVGSGQMLVRVADIIKATPGEKVVVVSALAGVTDALVDAVGRIRKDETAIAPFLDALRDRHVQAASDALADEAAVDAVSADIDVLMQRLERLLYGIAYTEEVTGKSRDAVVVFGERLSARLLAAVLRRRGTPAEALDAEAAGILTDGVYGNATPDMAATARAFEGTIAPRLKAGTTPVVTGFFGVDRDGHVTTFGRGGSDFAASIVAAALRAERLEVWKDVDGFMTADPRIIKDAVTVQEMSYDEAAELAYVGARVLHPRTVEPVKPAGIPIFVRNTQKPAFEGTKIHASPRETRFALRSAATKEKLAILRCYGPGMAYTPGIGARVFTALGQAKVNVYNMAASQASFALLVDDDNVEKGLKALEPVKEGIIERIEGLRDMTLVCVVGHGIGATHGTAGRIFSAVGAAGVNIEMISVGASDIALNFCIRSSDKERAVRAIHDAFLRFGGPK